MIKKILILPGDGIGPEIIATAEQVLAAIIEKFDLALTTDHALIGGAAIDASGDPLPTETLDKAKAADAVLLGAVGGPQWDNHPMEKRPEKALLKIRQGLGLFANLRPIHVFPELVDASTLKPDIVAGLDMLIVRELTGGLYFGEPRGIRTLDNGEREGYNTYIYRESEIQRIAKLAFELAEQRNHKLCSIDKANVLEVTRLWREIVDDIAQSYPNTQHDHMYVDNAAMQLVRAPKQFDVMLTGNMFGDILSDCAAMLTGSIGMLPSASLNENKQGMYEPIHGSAPDIAGQNIANPLATILSVAMMLRYTFAYHDAAQLIESAVQRTLAAGYRTVDIYHGGDEIKVSTEEMGQQILKPILS